MSKLRLRRLSGKRRKGPTLPAPKATTRAAVAMQAAPGLAPAAAILEWCADHYDRDSPVEAHPRFWIARFIDERPWMATFILLHVFVLVALLTNAKLLRWVTSNVPEMIALLSCVGFLWLMPLFLTWPGSVVFYQIDLEGERIVLHVPGSANRIRITTLSFSSITSVRPFEYGCHSGTSGIDIGYLDEQLNLKGIRVPDRVPVELIKAHMAALRPALGQKVEETIFHDT